MPATDNTDRFHRIGLKGVLDGRLLRSVPARYGAAALAVAFGGVVCFLAMQFPGNRLAYLTLYPVVMISAIVGGFGPGVFAAALSTGLVAAAWRSRLGDALADDRLDWMSLGIFVVCSIAISGIVELLHRVRRRLRQRTRALVLASTRLRAQVEKRNEVDARLRESEERFRLAASSDGIVFYEQDEALRYTWLYPPQPGHDSTLGKRDAEILPAAEGEVLARHKQEVMTRGIAQRVEIREKRGGGVKYYDTFITPRRDEDGRIVGVAGTALDITDRKQREQSRQLLAAIVEYSEDAIIALDLAGTIASWNLGATRLFGYAPEETIGQPVTLLIPPERHDEEPRLLERIRNGERIEHYETRRRRKDGTELDISLSVSPLRNDGGEIVGASKIARDVTGRNRAERNRRFLAGLNDRLASCENPDELVELASRIVGGYMHAQRCCFAEWHEESGHVTVPYEWRTVDRPSLVGTHQLSDCGPKEWRRGLAAGLAIADVEQAPELARFVANYRAFGVRSFATSGFVRKAPRAVSLLVAVDAPRVWRDDELQLLQAVAQRVWPLVERARSEAALRASERQLRLITDNAPVSLAHLDRGGRFKFVNQTYAHRFGRKATEIVGAHVAEIVGAAAYGLIQPHLDAAFDGRHVEFEMEIPYPHGGPRWVHAVYTPEILADGEVAGIIALISDVTVRKEAEREVALARDQALAASRAKDDFLAALSHELRTPLNPVLLIASEAAENPRLSAEVRREFATIRKNVELEARLIDDLLDVTRISHGKLPLDLRVVNGESILRDALSVIRPETDRKRIVLSVEFAARRATVHGDAVRLQLVFWNVLKNAVKFTPAGGRIAVTTGNSVETGALQVCVRDNGIGMVPEEIDRVFDAFAQGEHAAGASSHRFGGLGLGLTISRLVAELHHGSIRAESAGRGQGATFVVELPAIARPVEASSGGRGAATAVTRIDARKRRAPRRVLVVEDHQPTRDALASLLRRRGYEVLTAGSVAEARTRIASGGIGLLISDIGLPDGDGCELMSESRGQPGLRGIALTGYGMEADVARSTKAGFVAHLTKPIRVQALDATLASVCELAAEPAA